MSLKKQTSIIFGLGQSGLSCARYFDRISQPYKLLDTRENPPGYCQAKELKCCELFLFGKQFDFENIDETIFDNCSQMVVSPGISLSSTLVLKAQALGVDVCGDIEIFVRTTNKKIIAITGSNGKSTVTDLTDKLINAAGMKSQKGGNIGLPVLDFLPEDDAEIYVLELSSFQLDTTHSLKAEAGVLLNLSEDHLDRYSSFEDYCQSKKKIFALAESSVFNQDDLLTYPQQNSASSYSFSLLPVNDGTVKNCSYIRPVDSQFEKAGYNLMVNNKAVVLSESLNITGKHNLANILASLTLLNCMNITIGKQVLKILKNYKGLTHRFQLVLRKDNCVWINDSKATNVGATIAAINSIDSSQNHQLILIAGGDSKQNDLTSLKQPLEEKVNHLVLLGKDAKRFVSLLKGSNSGRKKMAGRSNAQSNSKTNLYLVDNMKQAIVQAKKLIKGRTTILLSPACSSLDSYENFEARGEDFIAQVKACV